MDLDVPTTAKAVQPPSIAQVQLVTAMQTAQEEHHSALVNNFETCES